jgi:hypothetical protein
MASMSEQSGSEWLQASGLPWTVHGSVLVLVLGLVACSTRGPTIDSDAMRCASQRRTLPASALELPNGGVTVSSATWVPAAPQRVIAPGETAEATPAHCKLVGYIDPLDPAAPKINFQLNLPQRWNGKAMQFGGNGFNGLLVTGLGAAPLAPPDAPLPIARGYATFGTDGGHQRVVNVEPQAFAANDEALENFAYAAYKKTRDAAVALIHTHYGARPQRIYYVGESEGGREGLTMAQRFPADYDGIYSAAPWLAFVGQQLAGTRAGLMLRGVGWLNPNKVALLDKAVLQVCDGLDGLNDGIVGHYLGCATTFDVGALRCSGGADLGDHCLSDAQVAAVRSLHSPLRLDFTLAHGISEYPRWAVGGEGRPYQWERYITGMAPAGPLEARNWLDGSGVVRHFVVRDPAFDPATFRPLLYRARLQRLSSMLDATDPDLSAFHAWGGKLILHEFSNDHARSPYAGFAYFQAVQAQMTAPVTEQFVRLYVTPGANHSGYGPNVPAGVDVVALLEQWVEQGRAPSDAIVQTLQAYVPPFAVQASKPMCRYPAYARYKGSGDPRQAGSYACTAP